MKALPGKHVLLIVENNAVPFDRRVWRQALTLRDAGANVSVICPVFGEDRERHAVIDGVHIYRYRLRFSEGGMSGYIREYLSAFLQTFVLLHRVRRERGTLHVVHVANPPDIFWPLGLYLRLWGTKFIFDEHDLTPETFLSRFDRPEEDGGLVFRVLRLFQRLSYRVAHAVIATNESYRARVAGVHPRYAIRTFVVRNGPDTRHFHAVPPNPDLKKGRRFMAAYIGIMAVQDGVDYIIRALDVLVRLRGVHDVIVYLIGTGDDVPRLRSMVHDLGLSDVVIFTGRIPDAPALEILSTADICLSPDPFNPLNNLSTMNKVMEYMALGKAIVSFDLKEARYSAGEAALYVGNNSVEAFAEGILRLLNDEGARASMGEVGRRRVEGELCWQRQAENLLRVYEFVLAAR